MKRHIKNASEEQIKRAFQNIHCVFVKRGTVKAKYVRGYLKLTPEINYDEKGKCTLKMEWIWNSKWSLELEAVVLGMPPYRPNRELAEVNPLQPMTVDV